MSNNKQHIEAQLVALFREVFGSDIASVVAYGSYVAGQWAPRSSDINLLVLVENCAPAALERLGATGHRMLRKHRVTPLIMTAAEFTNSADVFPMEYMDIIARHRVLYGADPTEHVQFSRKNLRHQLEHQLRGTMVSLRQLAVAARGRKRILSAELKQATGAMSAIFRGLLRLHGVDEVPTDTEALIRATAETWGFDLTPFLLLLLLRSDARAGERSGETLGGTMSPPELLAVLLDRLQELIAAVDRYDVAA